VISDRQLTRDEFATYDRILRNAKQELGNREEKVGTFSLLGVVAINAFIDGSHSRGLGGVVGLMLPLALAAAVCVPYTTSPCSDLGQVVNLSLSVA